MVVKFGKEYLRELFEEGKCSDKHHRYQPQVVKKYVLRVVTLQNAPNIEALYPLHSLNYEVLTGDETGISSIRIDNQYRLEFVVDMDCAEPTVTICTLEDITNHYKKSMAQTNKPFIAVHPGELVKDEIEARGISQKMLAGIIGVPYTMLNEILNGKRPVTTETALLLEAALDINAEMLVNMQSSYSLQTARKNKTLADRFVSIRQACAAMML